MVANNTVGFGPGVGPGPGTQFPGSAGGPGYGFAGYGGFGGFAGPYGGYTPPGMGGATYGSMLNAYGGYLPSYGTGFGPSFGGGWGNTSFSGQVTQPFGPSTSNFQGQELSDQQITSLLYDALDNDPNIPASANINVNVNNKVVTLTGFVRSKQTKRNIDHLAWAVPGVHDVHNNINVQSAAQHAAAQQGQQHAAAAHH